MTRYYDGTKLLSLKDQNGETPEIYICTSNRTAGKTTYFGRLLVNRYIKAGKKFGLLYRYCYELDNCAEKFFNDIHGLFFRNYELESERKGNGKYHELYLNGDSCGYAIAINDADFVKNNSHLFSDIDSLLFDEFQSETNKYCPKEIIKFISIHTSIARGHGKQYRRVPVYMLSNLVTLINPYYTEMGISHRLNTNTKFLRGSGWVLEQNLNESAANAQKQSAFAKAFVNNDYINYNTRLVYLNDNYAFIEKPNGKGKYICTIKYMGTNYAIKEYAEAGVLYCDYKVDYSCNLKISATTDDHNKNYVMLKRNELIVNTLRYFFETGCFRFKDLKCKEAIMYSLSY